jgi:hypothetical protein
MLPPLGAQTLPGSRGDEFVRHRSCFNRRIERMRAYLEQISRSCHFLWLLATSASCARGSSLRVINLFNQKALPLEWGDGWRCLSV